MKRLRLLLPALAFVVAGAWAIQVIACDKDKTTTTASAVTASHSSGCTAEMAAQCTPEMAAACRAKGAKTSAYTDGSSSCAGHSATTAAHQCPYMSGAASTAAFDACTDKASATTAANDHCAGKAAATMASSDHCAGKASATATTAAKSGSASKVSAMATGAGASCGMGAAALGVKSAHNGCDACADLKMCYEELEAAGARTQIVPLKNGVMFVYTAETPGEVNAVQSAMSRRSEHLAQFVTAGDKAHLCPDCQLIRGAMASGKMNREVVNIEGGALTLMTSNDPAIVAKIHQLVSTHEGTRSRI
jgi:hypothetical protein